MAKRDTPSARTTTSAKTNRTAKASAIETRVTAFATRLGRIAGTVQAKAEKLAGRTTKVAKAIKAPAASTAPSKDKGRSGGVVDAPGKKHRKPMPADPDKKMASSQAAKMRSVAPSEKTARRRGRG